MNSAEIVERLHGRPAGPGRWRAHCPAHRGKSATSLSIREGSDGAILIHCFAGCGFSDICVAMGVRPADLFAGPREHRPEDDLDAGSRAAIGRARESFRHHPAASRTEVPLTVVTADGEHADTAIARGLALAAEAAELVQITLEEANAVRPH